MTPPEGHAALETDGDGLTVALGEADGETDGDSAGGGAGPTNIQFELKMTPPLRATVISVAFERL